MIRPVIPADKANHAIYGALVFCAATLGASLFAPPRYLLIAAAAAVAVVAVGKEVADRFANWRAARAGLQPPHGVELLDVAATCAGGVLAALPLLISEYL